MVSNFKVIHLQHIFDSSVYGPPINDEIDVHLDWFLDPSTEEVPQSIPHFSLDCRLIRYSGCH